MGGIDLLREARDLGIQTPAIVITGFGTIQTAVEAMRLGAYDYITKPFILEELLMTVNRALEYYKLQGENASLRRQLKDKYNFRRMIGNSLPMQTLYRVIQEREFERVGGTRTIKEIGKVLGLTERRVCQIHGRAVLRCKVRLERGHSHRHDPLGNRSI